MFPVRDVLESLGFPECLLHVRSLHDVVQPHRWIALKLVVFHHEFVKTEYPFKDCLVPGSDVKYRGGDLFHHVCGSNDGICRLPDVSVHVAKYLLRVAGSDLLFDVLREFRWFDRLA